MRSVAELETRLGALHQRTRETPLFNPVFQLSLDLSRALEAGETSLDDLTALVAELECDGLKARANRLRTAHGIHFLHSDQGSCSKDDGSDGPCATLRWDGKHDLFDTRHTRRHGRHQYTRWQWSRPAGDV